MLYVRQAGEDLIKGDDQTFEQRGGQHVARVQTGYEKDGSPRYKYFKTQDEYRKYMETKGGKGKNKADSKKLKKKTDKERKSSKEKQEKKHGDKVSLFVKDKKNQTTSKDALHKDPKKMAKESSVRSSKTVKKSFPLLFVGDK